MKGKLPTDSRVLDGKYCNQLWLELKTLARVQERLTKEGIRSPRTHGPVSRPAIAMSVWRWCCRNPDESFIIEQKARAAYGENLTREEWNIELIIHARNAHTHAGYRKWLAKNGLEELARKQALSE